MNATEENDYLGLRLLGSMACGTCLEPKAYLSPNPGIERPFLATLLGHEQGRAWEAPQPGRHPWNSMGFGGVN